MPFISGTDMSTSLWSDALIGPRWADVAPGCCCVPMPYPMARASTATEIVCMIEEPMLSAMAGNLEFLRLPAAVDGTVLAPTLTPKSSPPETVDETVVESRRVPSATSSAAPACAHQIHRRHSGSFRREERLFPPSATRTTDRQQTHLLACHLSNE